METSQVAVVRNQVLEDNRNGVDDEQGDDLDDAEQAQHVFHQRTQLNPAQAQYIVGRLLGDVVLDGLGYCGGPCYFFEEVLLQFFNFLSLDYSLEDVVLLEN